MDEKFINGEWFSRTIRTPKGLIGFTAETVIEGKKLTLKNLGVFSTGHEPKTGLTRYLLAARTKIMEYAKAQGFSHIRIMGQRTPQGTSAKPGKLVDLTRGLEQKFQPQSKQEKERDLSRQRRKLITRSRDPRGRTRGRGGHEHER
jgi:hypothetical protein